MFNASIYKSSFNDQKQPSKSVLCKAVWKCSMKGSRHYTKIHRKIPVMEAFIEKLQSWPYPVQGYYRSYFPMNSTKFFGAVFHITLFGDCFWVT